MRGHARVGWAVAFATVCVLHAGVAGAAGTQSENLTVSGSLTYTWQGDTARGCAAVGVCDVRGELILKPLGGGQSVTFGGGGPPDIFVGASGVVRVLRTGAGGGECVDIPDQVFNGLDIRLPSSRSAKVVLESPPASGRCAGPLQSDLSGISIPVRRMPGRRPSFVMRGTQSFAAGPFSGSLISDLTVKATPANQAGFSGSSSSGGSRSSGSSPASSRTVLERVQLAYRISSASSIQTTFAGADGCEILDACGARGSLSLSVDPAGQLTVFATRVVRHRPSKRQALSDLRRGRLRVNGFATAGGTVAESYSWGDGTSCQDSVSTPVLELALGSPGSGLGGRLPLALSSNNGPDSETLRTHCAGPTDADLVGSNGPLASGFVGTDQLLSKHLTVDLTEPEGFTGLGYSGTRQGALRLELTLTKVSVGR